MTDERGAGGGGADSGGDAGYRLATYGSLAPGRPYNGQLDGLALAGGEGEHGRAVLQRLGRPARVQQQGRDMQAQGQVVGHGLDRRPQTVEQLRVDRHGGNSMARAPP